MTDHKPITDKELARILAYCKAAESGPEDLATLLVFWKQARTDLPGLIAEVRELREALGELLACENMLLLLKMAKKPEPGKYKEWAERHVEAIRRAVRILKG